MASNPITTMLAAAARKEAEKAGVPGVVFDMVVSKLDGSSEAIAAFFNASIDAKRTESIRNLAEAARHLREVEGTMLASGGEKEAQAVSELRVAVLTDLAALYDDGDETEEEEPPTIPQ